MRTLEITLERRELAALLRICREDLRRPRDTIAFMLLREDERRGPPVYSNNEAAGASLTTDPAASEDTNA